MSDNTTFSVSLTLDIQAENPLEAAHKFRDLVMDTKIAEEVIYDVVNEETEEKFTVDLSEEDEDAVLPNND